MLSLILKSCIGIVMAKLPTAKVGFLKTTTEFSQLSKDISLLQSLARISPCYKA